MQHPPEIDEMIVQPTLPQLRAKLNELDLVDAQMRRGIITARECVSQRVRVLSDASAILKGMIRYELGE
jgi:hypothetical protein